MKQGFHLRFGRCSVRFFENVQRDPSVHLEHHAIDILIQLTGIAEHEPARGFDCKEGHLNIHAADMGRAEDDRADGRSAVIPQNGQPIAAEIQFRFHQRDQDAMRQGMEGQMPNPPAILFKPLEAFFPAVGFIVRLWKTEHMDKRT